MTTAQPTLALETMQQNRFERFAMILTMTKMAHSIEKKRTEQQAAAENLIRWHRFIINQYAQH